MLLKINALKQYLRTQAGTSFTSACVAVMWRIPPPNSSPTSTCPPFFAPWKLMTFSQCKTWRSLQSRDYLFYCLWPRLCAAFCRCWQNTAQKLTINIQSEFVEACRGQCTNKRNPRIYQIAFYKTLSGSSCSIQQSSCYTCYTEDSCRRAIIDSCQKQLSQISFHTLSFQKI